MTEPGCGAAGEPPASGPVPTVFADGSVHDPAAYRRLCEPFENPDVAHRAFAEFVAGVRELRCKFKIPDVVVVAELPCKVPVDAAGRPDASPAAVATARAGPLTRWAEVRIAARTNAGDTLRVPDMLAKALQQERLARREAVADAAGDPGAGTDAERATARAEESVRLAVLFNDRASADVATAEAVLAALRVSQKHKPERTLQAGGACCLWVRADRPELPSELPPELFDRLTGGRSFAGSCRAYVREEEAVADLAQAHAAAAREVAARQTAPRREPRAGGERPEGEGATAPPAGV